MRYADAPAAIEWLERAFGFRRKLVVPGPDGTIVHAELELSTADGGWGVVMLGSLKDDEFPFRTPRQLGGQMTQCVCACLPEVDDHCATARAAGAEIVYGPRDTSYGSREYGARDPEGQLWCFGTYRPED
jgi:uncharacterized glyoxalase superfamily protein PhnB